MKIAISQLNYTVGDFEANLAKIRGAIIEARGKNTDLIIFSELAIGGYPAFDRNSNLDYIEKALQSLEAVQDVCKDIICIVGAVSIDKKSGQRFNAAYIIENGTTEKIIQKKRLCMYDWYDEARYFHKGKGPDLFSLKGKRVYVAIGDDINELKEPFRHSDLLIHLHSKPFSYTYYPERALELTKFSQDLKLPILQVNHVGGHGDMLFEGRSLAINKKAVLIDELLPFNEEIKFYLFDTDLKAESSDISESPLSDVALIHDALIMGVKDFFAKQGFKKAVFGLSGGLDSALVAALVGEAIGPENVFAVLLPSIYSSDHSLKDALDLVKNMGCKYEIIPIKEPVAMFEAILAPLFDGREFDVTEENIQARSRGLILMAISNKLGHVVLNTSNKSEAAVGYGTLYGDMVGSLSVIGDVYKSQAYKLAKYINRNREVIPVNTIIKPPSAELRPDQKDSDSLPDYPLLDAILFQYIDKNKSASEIIAQGFDENTVNKIIKLVDRAEFKRYQAPPILRVSDKAFGRARIMPLVSK